MESPRTQENIAALRDESQTAWALEPHGIDDELLAEFLQQVWLLALQTRADTRSGDYNDWLRRISMIIVYSIQQDTETTDPAFQIHDTRTNDLQRDGVDVHATLKSFRDRMIPRFKSRPGLKNVGATLAMFQSQALQPIKSPTESHLQNPARTLKRFRESSDLDTGTFART